MVTLPILRPRIETFGRGSLVTPRLSSHALKLSPTLSPFSKTAQAQRLLDNIGQGQGRSALPQTVLRQGEQLLAEVALHHPANPSKHTLQPENTVQLGMAQFQLLAGWLTG